jgi:hypothetical protein
MPSDVEPKKDNVDLLQRTHRGSGVIHLKTISISQIAQACASKVDFGGKDFRV